MGQKSLEQQIKELVESNDTSGKVVQNIKKEIAEAKADFSEDVKDCDFYTIYLDSDTRYANFDFVDKLQETTYFEDELFNGLRDSNYNMGFSESKELIEAIEDFANILHGYGRIISRLEKLLK